MTQKQKDEVVASFKVHIAQTAEQIERLEEDLKLNAKNYTPAQRRAKDTFIGDLKGKLQMLKAKLAQAEKIVVDQAEF